MPDRQITAGGADIACATTRRLIGANMEIKALQDEILACELCTRMPLGPRPVFQFHEESRILIAELSAAAAKGPGANL